MSTETARTYQFLAAATAGADIGAFASQEQAQEFYSATNGPLPFAKTLFQDERLVSAFTQAFMGAFNATGFVIRF